MNIQITPKELKTRLEFVPVSQYKEAFSAGIQIGQWLKSKSAYAVAANQVGIALRLFVVRKAKQNGLPTDVFINPTYVATPDSRRKLSGERCLSFPGQEFKIVRDSKVLATYYDPRERREFTILLVGLPAVIFQHETDHLNGIDDERLAKLQEAEVEAKMKELKDKFAAMEAEFKAENPGPKIEEPVTAVAEPA